MRCSTTRVLVSAIGFSVGVYISAAVAVQSAERGLRGSNAVRGLSATSLKRAFSRGGSSQEQSMPSSLLLLYGTAWKKEATTDLVVAAVRAGFRGIDTACQPKHYSEDLVGAAVQTLVEQGVIAHRDELWLQTKYTPLSGQDPERVPYDAEAPLETQVGQSIQRSLENLRTNRIDSLILHSPLAEFDDTLRVWRAMEAYVQTGVVTQLGISNCYDADVFTRLYSEATVKPRVLQNRFYDKSGYDSQLRAFCIDHSVTYQTFWTLTANPRKLESRPITDAAERLGATPQQVLFRFLVQSGHQPLTGTKSEEHMLQDLRAVKELALSPEEMTDISRLFGP